MATATGLAASVLLGLLMLLATARREPGRSPTPAITPAAAPADHPESLTAVLEPDSEEYLAWLADHHWPADEYLDLELEWRNELAATELPDPFELTVPYETPQCPQCRLHREDVWPCPQCGRLLHSSCGHGMRRRRLAHPYRTQATNPEAVIAEWICTGCMSVVGLDVDHGDEADDDLRR
ncbi:hypothetical protein GCM10010191_30100 [Actinomadura vinacea]|uniref:Uncharacterized protein n=1 Tax=Actinomadura vinacea TaxID=115336 RepID=A0ABN3J0B7_9ACTN